MLVIISDLHLTDGTSGQTIKENAFKIFTERVRDMAFEASFRQKNPNKPVEYKPVEQVDILLLGDILDIIRSTAWLTEGSMVRPWSDPSDNAFIEKVKEISDTILAYNVPSLTYLRNLTEDNGLMLPPPDTTGRQPAHEEPQCPVVVNIHYMVGNHDWFYHLSGDSYNPLRQNVVQAMGLANDFTEIFPHAPEESDELEQVLRDHEVLARHGDIYDPFNFAEDRDESSLGDCIVVELLNRFPLAVEDLMESELPEACLNGLRELDNVRPLLAIPIWIDALLKKTGVCIRQVKRVKGIWDDLVDEFLQLDFVRDRDSFFNPFDNVDKLQIALKFSKGISLGTAGRLAAWWNEQMGVSSDSYYTHAVKEKDFKNRSARYVVYGHTHDHEIMPLDVSTSESQRLDQMYFNSGTWRRVHRLTKAYPDEQEFIAYNVMTYLAFFKGDERKGRPFACWSGALGERRQ